MDSAAMHLQPQGATESTSRVCRYCGAPFVARRRWQEFCGTKHRNAFHGERLKKAKDERLTLIAGVLRYVGREIGGEIGSDIEAMDPKAVLTGADALRAVQNERLAGSEGGGNCLARLSDS